MDLFRTRWSDVYAFAYFGVIILLSLVESYAPRRSAGESLRVRWFSNFAVAFVGTALAKLVVPIAGLTLAALCADRGWGIFHAITVPLPVQFVLTILAIDLAGYGQHYLQHRIPILWRIHRTHHSDLEYDFSTGARFHPIETVFTTAILLLPVVALGAPPAAVLVSQLISTIVGFVEHGNVRIAPWFDRALRTVLVTSEMHRIHHSRDNGDSQTNYGGTFTWWDRLFRTYREEPAAGHDRIRFGVEGFEERKYLTLQWMLVQPLVGEKPDPTPGPAEAGHYRST